ncbi:hypothetical protein UB32_08535 [Mesobacillus subterraneus]|uniref:Uncharacterized protein n=2 Tax=Mesobacillus TaxID=2675231 RepID=A0A0D6ZA93_9BACI|nr:hypothetical protein UB32_08535 [Mesobacillus subterraneus]MDQ0414387.1 hypothetical protein [Mesobacillus stamsii]
MNWKNNKKYQEKSLIFSEYYIDFFNSLYYNNTKFKMIFKLVKRFRKVEFWNYMPTFVKKMFRKEGEKKK